MYISIVTKTFLFNIIIVIVFSIIYSSLDPNNFEPSHPKDKLTYIDFLFYALTIQCGVGLPDVMGNLRKVLEKTLSNGVSELYALGHRKNNYKYVTINFITFYHVLHSFVLTFYIVLF